MAGTGLLGKPSGSDFGMGPVHFSASLRQKSNMRGVVTPLHSKRPGGRNSIAAMSYPSALSSTSSPDLTPSFIDKISTADRRHKKLLMMQKKMQLSEAMQKKLRMDQAGLTQGRMRTPELIRTANLEVDKMMNMDDFRDVGGTPPEERMYRHSPQMRGSPLLHKVLLPPPLLLVRSRACRRRASACPPAPARGAHPPVARMQLG